MLIASGLCALFLPLIVLAASFLVPREYNALRLLLLGQAASFIASIASMAIYWTAQQPLIVTPLPGLLELKFDFLALTMSIMIGFISTVVVAYSERQLVGERIRLRFTRGLVMLAFIASLLATANTLLTCAFCWMGISVLLFSLTGMRQGNKAAARTLILHHLLSDIMFVAALALIGNWYHAGSLSALTASHQSAAYSLHVARATFTVQLSTIASLLLVASMCVKTALFPFHRWLLATLEAPTPLSGLLHAGVVNVAAIVATRFFPVLEQTPYVLVLWGLMATASAVIGTIVSSAQVDVKRKLVFSTVGQMGFMSLQCVVGALPAAIFHLITHGLFKCHLFLRSGSAVSEGLLKRRWNFAMASERHKRWSLLPLIALTVLVLPVCYWLMNDYSASSKSALSLLVMTGAVASALPALKRIGWGVFIVAGIAFTSAVVVERLLANGFDSHATTFDFDAQWMLTVIIAVFGVTTFLLHLIKGTTAGRSLYVHALSGFYLEDVVAAFRGRIMRLRGYVSTSFARISARRRNQPDTTSAHDR